MKNLTNTQGSVWLAILVIIAIVVAALLLSGNSNLSNLFSDDQSIHGLVSEIDHEGQYFLLEEVEVLSVAEDGSAEIRTTEYVVSWTGNHPIKPHHPDLLDGGEMVRVTPREQLEEREVLIVDPEAVEVTRGREPGEADNFEVEEDSDTPATTSTTTTSSE